MAEEMPPLTIPYAIPSDRIWFDPRLIAANNSVYLKTFTLVMGTELRVAIADNRRWAIGFCQPSPGIQIQVAPWPNVAAFMFDQMPVSFRPLWYTLFDFGPLICNPWYCLPPNNGTLRVVELIREAGDSNVQGGHTAEPCSDSQYAGSKDPDKCPGERIGVRS